MHRSACLPSVADRASQLPVRVRAHVWIEARHFFSRSDAQNRCWLWLVRDDGQVRALVLPSQYLNRNSLLPDLVRLFDADQDEESMPGATLDVARALPHAPVVPVPRWQVSWGHPVQRAIRDFAAHLDPDVLHALGDLETPGPFLGSTANYNRLAALHEPVRSHRLQALAQFPPLVAPVLLDVLARADMFGDGMENAHSLAHPHTCKALFTAIDRGRDLIGALATHWHVDRALVRSPLCRAPWSTGTIPADALRLFAMLPAQARPRSPHEVESRLPFLKVLPITATRAGEVRVLAHAFARGWNETWSHLEAIEPSLQNALYSTRDFLAAALEQAVLPRSLADMTREHLALAWVGRRGIESLLLASRRWHAQPLEHLPIPEPSAPRIVLERALEEIELAGGRIEELLTEAALIEEGERMHHCVADYWHACLTSGTRIVHLRLPGGERATAEYALEGRPYEPFFTLVQLLGPCNAAVSTTMDRLAHDVLKLLNAPEQAERRARVADTADAALRHLDDCVALRRTVRRLDARSLMELARVMAWFELQDAWKERRDELFRGYVAGTGYAECTHVLDQLRSGDRLTLAREPANPHDRDAVRVDWRARKVGYIPRERNRAIARMLDSHTLLDARIVSVNHQHEPWSCIEILVERGRDGAA